MHHTTAPRDGARDFDFWIGRWRVRNERLVKRLQACTEWETFDATVEARCLPGGRDREQCALARRGTGARGPVEGDLRPFLAADATTLYLRPTARSLIRYRGPAPAPAPGKDAA